METGIDNGARVAPASVGNQKSTNNQNSTNSALTAEGIVLPPIELIAESQGSTKADGASQGLSRAQSLEVLTELYGARPYNVGRFQKNAGLNVTGELDSVTRGKILEVYNQAMANPEEAIMRGLVQVAPGSAEEFQDVVREKLKLATGASEESLKGAGLFKQIREFQKSQGMGVDGVVGTQTMGTLNVAVSHASGESGQQSYTVSAIGRDGGGSNGGGHSGDHGGSNSGSSGGGASVGNRRARDGGIPVGANAVANAGRYFSQTVENNGFFEPLMFDSSPQQLSNPEGVIALQGLLRTVGYRQPMVPGFFDENMGEFIKQVQDNLVARGQLTPYQQKHGVMMQLDINSGEAGAIYGTVGKDSFLALMGMAKESVSGKGQRQEVAQGVSGHRG